MHHPFDAAIALPAAGEGVFEGATYAGHVAASASAVFGQRRDTWSATAIVPPVRGPGAGAAFRRRLLRSDCRSLGDAGRLPAVGHPLVYSKD
jgi:hypothetical protein